MSENIINNLYERSNKLIKEWMSNDFSNSDTYKNDPFLSVQEKPNGGLLDPKYIELMPEPFFGDPDKNLAVMLNLNPGFEKNDEKYIGKAIAKKKLSPNYSDFAKTNPYLTDEHFHPNAYKWWKKRYDWLQDLECHKTRKLPFVMELCPWHSKNWSEAGIHGFSPKQKDYIEKNVLLPAAYAARRSELGFVISIGKIYTNLYSDLGFTVIKKWGPDDKIVNWPISTKTRKPKEVHFAYYKRIVDGETIKVLSIWLWGSNKTPCKEFLSIEKDIIEHMRND